MEGPSNRGDAAAFIVGKPEESAPEVIRIPDSTCIKETGVAAPNQHICINKETEEKQKKRNQERSYTNLLPEKKYDQHERNRHKKAGMVVAGDQAENERGAIDEPFAVTMQKKIRPKTINDQDKKKIKGIEFCDNGLGEIGI